MQRGRELILLISLLSIVGSCGTVRMRYGAKFETQNQKKGEFVYEKSYPVGNLQTWCIITGILYGGACWFYLGLPYEKHQNMIKRDARIKLGSKVNETDLKMYEENISRLNFKDLKEHHSVSITGSIEEPAKKIKTPVQKEREDTSTGFLR